MPIFEYQCKDCGKSFEILHKVKELQEDIICTYCNSTDAKRLMSIPSIGSAVKPNNPGASSACDLINTPACSGNCDLFK